MGIFSKTDRDFGEKIEIPNFIYGSGIVLALLEIGENARNSILNYIKNTILSEEKTYNDIFTEIQPLLQKSGIIKQIEEWDRCKNCKYKMSNKE